MDLYHLRLGTPDQVAQPLFWSLDGAVSLHNIKCVSPSTRGQAHVSLPLKYPLPHSALCCSNLREGKQTVCAPLRSTPPAGRSLSAPNQVLENILRSHVNGICFII